MTFIEIINLASRRCRETLLAEIGTLRDAGSEVVVEPFPRTKSGEILHAQDGLRLPLRYDLVTINSGGSVRQRQIDAPTIKLVEPEHAVLGESLSIEMRSLTWVCVNVTCRGHLEPVNFEPLESWFLERVDLADDGPPDSDGLHGVVHFLSDPIVSADTLTFTVDFGSASSTALLDLFDVLFDLGYTHCIVGQTAETPCQ